MADFRAIVFVILFHADKFPSVLNKIKRTQLEEHK